MTIKKRLTELSRKVLMGSLGILFRNKKNAVVFCSFHGKQYSDNPRAISERLHRMRPDYRIIWLLDKKSMNRIHTPGYVHVVPKKTLKEYLALVSSKVWVYNNDLPYGTVKSKKQYYIQTWHGDRGFKRVRYDALENMGESYHAIRLCEERICDLAVAGSDEGEAKYRSAFHYSGEVLKKGCPRNDRLVRKNPKDAERIRKKLGLKDEKVVMYAPTFRDNKKGNQKADLDFDALKEKLEKKTGEKWTVLVRGHSLAGHLLYDKQSGVIDVTDYPDMADLLLVTSFLISDFSSTVNDFALLKRPLVLYLEDYEDYIRNNRELKYDAGSMGYPVVYNMNQLMEFVENMDQYSFDSICSSVLEGYGTVETGRASEAVSERIIAFVEDVNDR